MVQNNKVLTVSYGTFSCTLEGFDDSFETMKAIAEYFRDLAADDRYFGSEPPQPDAEMLTRIAQRDAPRHVEASQNDSGLLLRATEHAPTAVSYTEDAPQPPAPEAPDLAAINPPQKTEPEVLPSKPDQVQPAAADSIAAKLQRIRAVVSHAEDNPVAYSEEDDSGYLAAAKPKVDAISAAFEAGALHPDDLETGEAQASALAEAPLPPNPEPAPLSSELDTTQDDTAMVEDGHSEYEEDATADALFSDLDGNADDEEDEIVNILSDEDEIPEIDPQPHAAPEPQAPIDTALLTAKDEETLLNGISEVEAHLEAQTGQDDTESSDIDQDVSRLMDKAGAQMDDPEASDKRTTYSHLRAAIAVTEADRGSGTDAAPATDADYRGDLASVVSPRRPEEVQATSARPETDGAAPLKLVAEQRIDTEEANTGPITPRRIDTSEGQDAEEEGGFAMFAQEQGAQSLPDLLEAAAAYLSFIEGQEQFSRPQLMNKIRALKQDEFNREESLRSFGQLLRDGKIERAGGGRFSASNQIGFRPNDERAAG